MEPPYEEASTLSFRYIKGPDCKTYFVEGAAGGITPRGNLHLHLYQERRPTPDSVTHRLEADGRLGGVESVSGREGFIREIQCGIVLEPATAFELFAWLGKHLNELQEAQSGLDPEDDVSEGDDPEDSQAEAV